jgi:alpha-1,2-mannosyltransferase
VLGILAVLAAMASVSQRAMAPALVNRFRDLQAYRIAGHLVWHAPSLLYSFHTSHGAPFTYSPAAAALFTPLAHVSLTTAGLLLGWLTLLAAAAVTVVIARAGRIGTPVHAAWLLLLFAGVVYALPVRNSVSLGQIDAVLMLLVVIDMFVVPERWRGILTGAAAAIKVTPLLFVPYLFLRGQRRAAAAAVGTFLAVGGVAWAALPGPSTMFWLHALWHTDRVGSMHDPRNRSLPGALVSAGVPGTVALGIGALFACWVLWRAATAAEPAAAVAAVGCTAAYVTPITWSHHLVWIAPALVALGATGRRGRLLALAAVVGFWDWPTESLHVTALVQAVLGIAVVLRLLTGQRTIRMVPPPVFASRVPAVPSPM